MRWLFLDVLEIPSHSMTVWRRRAMSMDSGPTPSQDATVGSQIFGQMLFVKITTLLFFHEYIIRFTICLFYIY